MSNNQSENFQELFLEYVGTKLKLESPEITVEMVLEVLTAEFPDVVMALASENFLRGYAQATDDIANIVPKRDENEL